MSTYTTYHSCPKCSCNEPGVKVIRCIGCEHMGCGKCSILCSSSCENRDAPIIKGFITFGDIDKDNHHKELLEKRDKKRELAKKAQEEKRKSEEERRKKREESDGYLVLIVILILGVIAIVVNLL